MGTCAEPVKLIPGPRGTDGAAGAAGTNGVDAFTTLTAGFTVPAVGGTAVATVGATSWMVVGQPLYLQGAGVFYVTAIGGATSVTLQNNAAETGNVAAGTVIAPASKLGPSGFKGAAGAAGGAGTGVTVATKGDIQTYAGAAANLPVGTNGQILRSLSTAGTGLDWEQIIPNASASTDNQIPRLDSPAGTETPANLQTSSLKLTDNGALQHTGGNAKGTDAIDLSPSRGGATQVASGNNSTVSGGRNNTASGADSSVSGGHDNTASGVESTVSGGDSNTASALDTTVGGGVVNTASATNATIAGGSNNTASGVDSVVSGGSGNTAAADDSTIAGGDTNSVEAGSDGGTVGGGFSNDVHDDYATIVGGRGNSALAGAAYGTILGGRECNIDKHGQVAHSSGRFASNGDAQTSEFIWRVTTTDATANVEMFLDGATATKRATVPNNTTWAFDILVAARRSNGDSICFRIVGGIKNDAGTTVLVAATTETVIADGTGGALTAANIDVNADNGNDALRIQVTGIAAQTWRWVAHGRIVEVGH